MESGVRVSQWGVARRVQLELSVLGDALEGAVVPERFDKPLWRVIPSSASPSTYPV